MTISTTVQKEVIEMKQVYQADWDKVREKFNPNLLDEETLTKLVDNGYWGRAFTTDLVSLSNVIIIRAFREGQGGRIDVSLEASSEEEAKALLSILEREREYFFAFDPSYPWREVLERKLSGDYVGKQFHYKVSKENFRPQIKHEITRLSKEHSDMVKSYSDEEERTRCHNQFRWSLDNGGSCMGAISEEELVSICCAAGNNVNWVHTLESFRGKSYGKSVVSGAVMDILEKEDEATYDADDYNIASIKLCKGLGFTPYNETLFFIGRPI